MTPIRAFALAAFVGASILAAPAAVAFSSQPAARFRPVDVFIDSASRRLAAYQVEVIATNATIAGIEGGEHSAFHEPPYYDPKALKGGRIILAAFDAQGDVPQGRTRVATLHMHETGHASYEIRLMAAGDPSGQRIAADASVQVRN